MTSNTRTLIEEALGRTLRDQEAGAFSSMTELSKDALADIRKVAQSQPGVGVLYIRWLVDGATLQMAASFMDEVIMGTSTPQEWEARR